MSLARPAGGRSELCSLAGSQSPRPHDPMEGRAAERPWVTALPSAWTRKGHLLIHYTDQKTGTGSWSPVLPPGTARPRTSPFCWTALAGQEGPGQQAGSRFC